MKGIWFVVLTLFMVSCAKKKNVESAVNVSNGRVERIENFESEYIKTRNVDVWLPEGYSERKKYSVLYMHDGQMLFDSTTTWNGQDWGVDEVLGELLERDKVRETIVVGIYNTNLRHAEYFPQKPFEMLEESFRNSLLKQKELFAAEVQSDNYLKFLVNELKPFIDEKYSTSPEKEETFVAGSSMGGLISMYAICEYPEVFAGAACLSTHWIGIFNDENNPIPQQFMNYLNQNLPSPHENRIYFDYGTETLDAYYEPYQLQADSIMEAKGFWEKNCMSLKFEGENHSENAWRKRLHIPLEFLLSKED